MASRTRASHVDRTRRPSSTARKVRGSTPAITAPRRSSCGVHCVLLMWHLCATRAASVNPIDQLDLRWPSPGAVSLRRDQRAEDGLSSRAELCLPLSHFSIGCEEREQLREHSRLISPVSALRPVDAEGQRAVALHVRSERWGQELGRHQADAAEQELVELAHTAILGVRRIFFRPFEGCPAQAWFVRELVKRGCEPRVLVQKAIDLGEQPLRVVQPRRELASRGLPPYFFLRRSRHRSCARRVLNTPAGRLLFQPTAAVRARPAPRAPAARSPALPPSVRRGPRRHPARPRARCEASAQGARPRGPRSASQPPHAPAGARRRQARASGSRSRGLALCGHASGLQTSFQLEAELTGPAGLAGVQSGAQGPRQGEQLVTLGDRQAYHLGQLAVDSSAWTLKTPHRGKRLITGRVVIAILAGNCAYRRPYKPDVAGSSPVPPTTLGGVNP